MGRLQGEAQGSTREEARENLLYHLAEEHGVPQNCIRLGSGKFTPRQEGGSGTYKAPYTVFDQDVVPPAAMRGVPTEASPGPGYSPIQKLDDLQDPDLI